jgi:hypothetical protein
MNWKNTAEYGRGHFPRNKNTPRFIPGEMPSYVLFSSLPIEGAFAA